jgi:phage repressor protein C with HTH and peptisase S24 domain
MLLMTCDNTLRIANVNTRSIATSCIAPKMLEKSERLRQARQKAGYSSAVEAARAFGWTESAYRHHENGTRGFGPDAAKRYGRAFKVKPSWLLALEGATPDAQGGGADDGRLLVNGSVEAGAWRNSEHWDDERTFFIEGMPSPVPGAKRFGLVVAGQSMNEFYEPGTVLDCISIFSKSATPKPGDHVIVQRTKAEGGLRELTVKEYVEQDGKKMLVPRSTKDGFHPYAYPGPDKDHPPGEDEVEVIGFVLTAYPPRTLDLMRRMGVVKEA